MKRETIQIFRNEVKSNSHRYMATTFSMQLNAHAYPNKISNHE